MAYRRRRGNFRTYHARRRGALYAPATRGRRFQYRGRQIRRRRANQNRTIRRTKQRQVYQNRRMQNILRPIHVRQRNYRLYQTANTFHFQTDTFTLVSDTTSQNYGRFFFDLIVDNFATGSQLAYITSNWGNCTVLQFSMRIQMINHINPQIIQTATTQTGTAQVAQIPVDSTVSITPEVYCRLTYDLNDTIPLGGTKATASTSMLVARQQWLSAPRVKSLLNRHPCSIYWTAPKPVRSEKLQTTGLTTTSGFANCTTAIGAQRPSKVNFFWADFDRYIQDSATSKSTLIFAIQTKALWKLNDNVAFTSG